MSVITKPLRRETEHLYLPIPCKIVSVRDLTPMEKLFRIQMPDGQELGHKPGQFIQLSILGYGEAPISVASSPTRRGYFELGVRNAGTLTGALHHLSEGDEVGIRGPFGTFFDVEKLAGKDLLLISGGCGLAPMRSLIQYCQDRPEEFGKITILYGAKTPSERLFKEDLVDWARSPAFACKYAVDCVPGDGCFDEGEIGLITVLIPPLKIDVQKTIAVIVGPPVMYKFVIAELKKKGMTEEQIIVSLERYMKCGVGKCGHCAIEHLYCCLDGPVFWLNQISGLRGAI
ncbi:MAG: oxidoreductase [Candidatus Coatesbacteria bacterium]|nr:MAG: oxidoreductase [Candidatus Coatesbacteria bacterium]